MSESRPIGKVLVVDDQLLVRSTMESILATIDIETIHASSGVEALTAVNEHHIGLVLIDVKMPEIDGYETARLIHSEKGLRHIPIIMFSGHPTEDQFIQAFEAGAVDFIAKPVKPIVLINKVQQFMLLTKLRQYAEAENDAKSLFLSTISHELRTPLNAMIGYTSKLLQRLDGKIETRDYNALGQVQDNANYQLRLVNDLLDLTMLRAGKFSVILQPVKVGEIIEEAVLQVQAMAI
ncbi:MAG: response regulator [Pseudomonadales bacterium]|nr:response regulator [Pseudomonadales bacterium]